MLRITEIKERIERYRSLDQWREDIEGANKNWEHIKKVRQEFEDTGLSDREHLLSRLEIAEKVLEEVLNVDDRDQAIVAHDIAIKALQQIRS